MKTRIVHIAALSAGIVAAVAAQDMSFQFAGAKPPFAAAAAMYAAFCGSTLFSIWSAFLAGLAVDALAGTPSFCASMAFPVTALCARFVCSGTGDGRVPSALSGAVATACAAVLCEIWLAASGAAVPDAEVFVRVCSVLAMALPVGFAAFAVLPAVGRHIGAMEEDL